MVGTDETTELWRPPPLTLLLPHSKHSDWMLEGRAPVLRDNMLSIVYLPSRLYCSLFVSTDMMRQEQADQTRCRLVHVCDDSTYAIVRIQTSSECIAFKDYYLCTACFSTKGNLNGLEKIICNDFNAQICIYHSTSFPKICVPFRNVN